MASALSHLIAVCLLSSVLVDCGPTNRGRRRRSTEPDVKAVPTTTVAPVYAPLTRCGRTTCDLRTHYCDRVITQCALCSDDCHPKRIEGNAAAIADCRQNCEWYYVFTSTPRPPTTTSTAASTTTTPQKLDHWAFDSEMTSAVLLSCLLIALVIILLLALGLVAHICIKSVTNSQPGSSGGVCMDASTHCRSVDDSKLLAKDLTSSLQSPESSLDLTGGRSQNTDGRGLNTQTTPKVPNSASMMADRSLLSNNASTEPLLRGAARSDLSHQNNNQ